MLRRHFGEPPHKTRRPAHQAHRSDGAALQAARRRKEARYPELLQPGPQRLLVLASEVGGRWHRDCEELLRLLVNVRAPRAPGVLRASAAVGWRRRWWSLLSVAVQHAVTTTALSGEWLLPATAPHLGLGALLRRDQSWTWRLSCAGRFPPPLGRSIASQDSPVV